jgi:hypothetical protein
VDFSDLTSCAVREGSGVGLPPGEREASTSDNCRRPKILLHYYYYLDQYPACLKPVPNKNIWTGLFIAYRVYIVRRDRRRPGGAETLPLPTATCTVCLVVTVSPLTPSPRCSTVRGAPTRVVHPQSAGTRWYLSIVRTLSRNDQPPAGCPLRLQIRRGRGGRIGGARIDSTY